MQWTRERHGGFSRGRTVSCPVNDDREYGYTHLNAAEQRRDPNSMLNWMEKLIRTRRECPEISWGQFEVLETPPEILALRYDWRGTSLVTIHNLADVPKRVTLDVKSPGGRKLVEVFHDGRSLAESDGRHHLRLPAFGHRWYRTGVSDNAPYRAER
jgi:maltose alpha-D-glucosyltransferase/alpha-amylase